MSSSSGNLFPKDPTRTPEFVKISSRPLANIQRNPLDSVSLQAAFLGLIFGVSTCLFFQVKLYNFPGYLIFLSAFHFLEFFTTAKYNAPKVTSDSFLLNHSPAYLMAHAAAIIEYIIEAILFPNFKIPITFIVIIGTGLVIGGQIMRSLAMKTAGESFSHVIVTTHNSDRHKLVTHGIYSISRHPSYTGYFWWAIGSQIFMMNPICLAGFSIALYKFFDDRIKFEEKLLIQFFADDYVNYKKQRGTLIPFIP